MSGGVRTQRVQVEAQGEIMAATVDGQPFDLSALSESARHGLQFNYYGLSDKGFELTLRITAAVPVKITVQGLTNGMPAKAGMPIRPRPANLMPAPQGFGPSDPTIVSKSFSFAR